MEGFIKEEWMGLCWAFFVDDGHWLLIVRVIKKNVRFLLIATWSVEQLILFAIIKKLLFLFVHILPAIFLVG